VFKKIAAAERRKRQRQSKTWKRYEKKTLGVFEHHTCAYLYNNPSLNGLQLCYFIFTIFIIPDKKAKSVISNN